MAHQVCTDITEWIDEQVMQPVQQCLERPCNWWCLCCNKWFCWIAWVLVTVGRWVTHTVCEIVADVVDLVVNVVLGLVDVIVGIFTLDWARVVDGLGRIVGGIVGFVLDIVRIVTLGDTVGYIRDEVNKANLRDYVRGLLEQRFRGDALTAAKERIGVDHGVFGLPIEMQAVRTFVRSDFVARGRTEPELIRWNDDASLRLPLKEVAGYTFSDYFRRARYEVVGASESDVDTYISSRGAEGPTFSIFCMDPGTLQTKLDVASRKARALGLIPRWTLTDLQVRRPDHVRHLESSTAIKSFLIDPVGRRDEAVNVRGATADLCEPAAVGIFFYTDKLNGLSTHLHESTCLDGNPFPGDGVSGVTFRDRIPDAVWQYVPIHELGHYFGLCHVDGIDRIMYSAAEKSWLDWSFLPEYLWLSGEPQFTLEEGMRAWDYIVANFPDACLTGS
jgi:hypothetical protein